MRKRIVNTITAALILALLAGCMGIAGGQTEEASSEPTTIPVIETVTATPEPPLRLRDDTAHRALMTLSSDGCFYAGAPVTKGELCRILYPLFEGLTGGGVRFTDLKAWNEGYRQTAALYCSGLLPDEEGGAFFAARSVTRSYLTEVLERISDALGGEDAKRARLLVSDFVSGATAAENADLRDIAFVTRGEMAVLLERLFDREPDENDLFMNGCKPPDVSTDEPCWAYYADAVTGTAVEPVEPGVHRLYGWLYAAWDDGTMIRDMDYGVWIFGADGRYTTGDEELDGYLMQALEECGANSTADDVQALAEAYLYIKYNYEYLVRPEDVTTIPVGVTGWEYERGVRFFRYRGGTCYGFAAGLCLMARALGFHAYAVAAEVNQFYGAHGFVVIPEGEVDYIYDVELEATRQERHGDLDLFHILNYDIYNYWYISNWREE